MITNRDNEPEYRKQGRRLVAELIKNGWLYRNHPEMVGKFKEPFFTWRVIEKERSLNGRGD